MSHDMSNASAKTAMSERKKQIVQAAIEIIASEDYGKLGMRALARASGMKLGALQYHLPHLRRPAARPGSLHCRGIRTFVRRAGIGHGFAGPPGDRAVHIGRRAQRRIAGRNEPEI
jgi:hypothetical protein